MLSYFIEASDYPQVDKLRATPAEDKKMDELLVNLKELDSLTKELQNDS